MIACKGINGESNDYKKILNLPEKSPPLESSKRGGWGELGDQQLYSSFLII